MTTLEQMIAQILNGTGAPGMGNILSGPLAQANNPLGQASPLPQTQPQASPNLRLPQQQEIPLASPQMNLKSTPAAGKNQPLIMGLALMMQNLYNAKAGQQAAQQDAIMKQNELQNRFAAEQQDPYRQQQIQSAQQNMDINKRKIEMEEESQPLDLQIKQMRIDALKKSLEPKPVSSQGYDVQTPGYNTKEVEKIIKKREDKIKSNNILSARLSAIMRIPGNTLDKLRLDQGFMGLKAQYNNNQKDIMEYDSILSTLNQSKPQQPSRGTENTQTTPSPEKLDSTDMLINKLKQKGAVSTNKKQYSDF